MPWTMNDYPSSLKNFKKPIKKKAIDIANAMIDEGYDEGRAIPIATEQAKEWYDNASKKEIDDFLEEGDPTERSEEGKQYENRPKLLDKAETVVSHEDGWAVQAKDAKKPTEVFDNKKDAIERAKDIAENKGTEAVIYTEDGKVEKRHRYSNNK
ncbi:DUF2188 domain-containing protein [Alteribacillus iranensis]|mgnify:CR=1 FL=1|uniref:Uncharacterized protein YdaT n=1 Tax=Alteribacillus iranensis TaxID=930128 RepID=A0A1I2BN96_9BACI|nr:DUF2188 domain-containing protein [Alteribacillus iranensis]SFE57632.1 Uncharacterized protein YdaT [Alteribacillus iranensis]